MEKVEGTGLELQVASQQDTTLTASTTCPLPSPPPSEREIADEWLRLWWGLPEGTTFKDQRWEGGVLHVTVLVPAPPVECIVLSFQI